MSVWIINTEPVNQSANVLAKHVRAEKTFYVDLNQAIPEGATISAPFEVIGETEPPVIPEPPKPPVEPKSETLQLVDAIKDLAAAIREGR